MKIVILVVIILLIFFIGKYYGENKQIRETYFLKELCEKHLDMVQLYDNWMMMKSLGESIEEYLKKQKIQTIAIYGMSYLGVRLYYELKGSSIVVKYGIDQNPSMLQKDLEIVSPENELQEVDAIVVTAIFSFNDIQTLLLKKGIKKVIALDEIIYALI